MLRTVSSPRRGGGSSGFTLLELIIVLVVIAALAALVVPMLGWVRDQTKYATAAAGAAEVLNNLETYKASTGKYPDRMDSFLSADGTYYTNLYAGVSQLTAPDTGFAYYYLGNGGGMTQVMQHNTAATVANESTDAGVPVALGPNRLAAILPTSPPSSNPYSAKYKRLVRTAYPNQADIVNPGVPTGHTLVALALGNRASSVGTTMTSAPIHGGASDPTKYSRFVAWFDVSAGGTNRGKVQLKMVTDSEFEVIAANVRNFQASGPIDDQGAAPPPPPEEPEDP